MAHVIFWEKPGCAGNARQQELLRAAGHELEVRNLLTEAWNEEGLRPFLAGLPVAGWFNPAHPRIKSKELQPAELAPDAALALLLADPLLIRRPLLQVGEVCRAGFEPDEIAAWIGLAPLNGSDPRHCPCLQAPPPPTPDRYVSFRGIDGDGNARRLVAMLCRYLDQPQHASPFWDLFRQKLALCAAPEQNSGRRLDELFLVHSYINDLYEFFESVGDEEALTLLASIETESC